MAASKLAIKTGDRDLAHRIAGLLGEIYEPAPEAVSVFEVGTNWLVEAYFSEPPIADEIAATLADFLEIEPPGCVVEEIEDLNWVALSQAALPPVEAGRFTIFGGHDRDRIPRGPNSILIDAGEAFGTAHHATTNGCLVAIDRQTRRRAFRNALDLGTGTGVLALALRRALPGATILATDLDQRSIEVARENATLNGAGSISRARIAFRTAAGLSDRNVRAAQPFDLIVANILASPLMALSGSLARALERRGMLVLSGILNQQAAAVISTYRAHGFALRAHGRTEGWSTLTFQKHSQPANMSTG